MTKEIVKEKLVSKFGESISFEEPYGMLTFTVPAMQNIEAMQYLWNEGFQFLTDLTGVHYPDRKNEELCVVYHLHNLVANVRVRMKAVELFAGANWMERETYDFYGINFTGHPDLRRILNVDEMDYFPMRKEYELEDPTRRDKDDEMFGR
jgi:NADH-quinone oxidoreductase subunit C